MISRERWRRTGTRGWTTTTTTTKGSARVVHPREASGGGEMAVVITHHDTLLNPRRIMSYSYSVGLEKDRHVYTSVVKAAFQADRMQ